MNKYSIGIDYGSLSVRSVLLDIKTGTVIDSQIYDYKNKIISDKLPNSDIKLKPNWALQDPNDYLNGLKFVIKELIKNNPKINKEDIIGIGVDFTSCTVLPTFKDGTPLCFSDDLKLEPHAWPKLWKHHAAEKEADEITKKAFETKQKWINKYGGKISSEWLFPKLLQILRENEELYKKIDCFIEATDWIVWQLTGSQKRNVLTAGFKAMYDFDEGFPSKDYFKYVDPRFENVIAEKIGQTFYKPGENAGTIQKSWAQELGLSDQTIVSIGLVDAHVSIASACVTEPNNMLMIMGTSTCDILFDKEAKAVKDICGFVKNSIIDGLCTYESGQNAVGDLLGWFVDNNINNQYHNESKKMNLNMHQYLTQLAETKQVGASGLIALDWINGNRSILVNNDLTGLILGLELDTKPEDIYRALIEATAFGKRRIIEEYEKTGIKINKVTVCGGLPHKNKLLNQIYANVLNKEIFIASELQAPAVSSALYGAVAAGKKNGGFDTIIEASKALGKLLNNTYKPIKTEVESYDKLYEVFKTVHDFFGETNKDLMKTLKSIKVKANE